MGIRCPPRHTLQIFSKCFMNQKNIMCVKRNAMGKMCPSMKKQSCNLSLDEAMAEPAPTLGPE